MAEKLQPKQQKFVEQYLLHGNATQAALEAGYAKASAGQMGAENLKKPKIAAAIAKEQAERTRRIHIDLDYVLQRLAIEAERVGEGASHSARVQALGQLRQHLEMAGSDPEEAPPLQVNVTVNNPVGDVRVTRPDA